ncbi:MAG: PTS system mannose/fructose/sorbose family transporter subunit IID [Elusimicrobia bacterium]|nr:PTS system mannose/fructose/sorbose family transporter subunit IID [Elusimicrobiota bacterium]
MSAALNAGMQGRLFARSLLIQSGWNFERMQSLGLAFCLEPWLERCWAGQEAAGREARLRHHEFFNTQPYMASLVVGMLCALEEEAAAAPVGADRDALVARLKTLKSAAAAALAGVGDALFWGALRPLCAGVAAAGALALWDRPAWAALWAAGSYLAVHNGLSLSLRWGFLGRGYEWRGQIAARLKEWPAQRLIRGLRAAGLVLVLAAAALLLVAAPAPHRVLGGLALAAAVLLRAARVSPYRLYAAAVLAGGAAAAAGWL